MKRERERERCADILIPSTYWLILPSKVMLVSQWKDDQPHWKKNTFSLSLSLSLSYSVEMGSRSRSQSYLNSFCPNNPEYDCICVCVCANTSLSSLFIGMLFHVIPSTPITSPWPSAANSSWCHWRKSRGPQRWCCCSRLPGWTKRAPARGPPGRAAVPSTAIHPGDFSAPRRSLRKRFDVWGHTNPL